MTWTADFIDTVLDALPHGSGFDTDWQADTGTEDAPLVLHGGYHCMDENGFYNGWLDVSVTVFEHDTDVYHALHGPCEGQFQILHRAGDIDATVEVSIDIAAINDGTFDMHEDYIEETILMALEERGVLAPIRTEVVDG
jgi:hypothetical protein